MQSSFVSIEDIQRPQTQKQVLPSYLTPPYPTTFTLELTSACNHRCIGCGNVFSRDQGALSGSEWTALLERIRPYSTSLRLTGGECTLHPDFEQILRAVDALDLPFVIFTNGCWNRADDLVKLFADCRNLDGLLISLHGDTPKNYARFVGVNTFAAVVRNIQRAVAAGIQVGTNTLLLSSTHQQIEAIAQISLGLGARTAAFSRYYGEPLPGLELNNKDLSAALRQITRLRQADPRIIFNNCVPLCFAPENLHSKGCTSGFTHCTVDPLGHVRPCTHSPILLGSLFTHTVEELWSSTALADWRALVPSDCLECGVFQICRGGCRATAYQRGLTSDPLMDTNRPMPTPAESLKLSPDSCPVSNFALRQEASRVILYNRVQQIVVTERALPLLRSLDGTTTLRDIDKQFGQAGLDFVGTLIKIGLIRTEHSGKSP